MLVAQNTAAASSPLTVATLHKENAPIICTARLSPEDLAQQINQSLLQNDLVEVVLTPDAETVESRDPAQNLLLNQLHVIRNDKDNIILVCDPIAGSLQNNDGICTMKQAERTIYFTALHAHNNGIALKALKLNAAVMTDKDSGEVIADTQDPRDIPLETELQEELTPSQVTRLNSRLATTVACLNLA